MTSARGPAAEQPGAIATWRAAPVAVKALLAGTFICRLGGFLQIFVVLYLIHEGYSSTQAAAALTAYGAGVIAGLFSGGWLADRLGARRTILASMTVSAALLLTVAQLHSYGSIVVAVAAVGAVSQAYRPAAASMLSALTPPGRQVMFGSMQQLALNVGATAAPLAGVVLIGVSYRLLFYGEATAAAVYALIAATVLPRWLPAGTAGDAERSADEAKPSYLAVLADRRYVVFLASTVVSALVYSQYVSTLPLYLRQRGEPTSTYGLLLALNSIVVITCQLPATRLVESWQARTAAVTGVLLTAIGMMLYGPWWGIAGLVVATLVWSVAECVGTPTVFFAHPVQAAPPALRGRYLGAVQAVFAAGYAAGPSAGVAVWNHVGGAVWWWAGATGAVAVVGTWAGIPGHRGSHAARDRAAAVAGTASVRA